MHFMTLIKKRRSVRSYKNTSVEEYKLEKVLEAGRMAPSACNKQPWYFVVVKDQIIKESIAEGYTKFNYKHYPSAYAFIVLCGDRKVAWHREHDGKDHCDIDLAIAADHMTLQAAELGLGTCWICAFDPQICASVLDLPMHVEPIIILHIGYPAEEMSISTKDRKEISEIVFYERFGQN
jgi:nitroreductase